MGKIKKTERLEEIKRGKGVQGLNVHYKGKIEKKKKERTNKKKGKGWPVTKEIYKQNKITVKR